MNSPSVRALYVEPKIGLACRLAGHTGNATESGYHVCDRCGLHEYHSHEEYQKAGLLLVPWYALARWVDRRANAVRQRWRNWRRRHDANEVPF